MIVDWLYGSPSTKRGLVFVSDVRQATDGANYFDIGAWEGWIEEWEAASPDSDSQFDNFVAGSLADEDIKNVLVVFVGY